jgi:hypothetical protein
LSAFATHPAKSGWIANRWSVVVGAVAGLTMCNNPVLLFTSGVFLKPVAADRVAPTNSPRRYALRYVRLYQAGAGLLLCPLEIENL